MYTQESSRRTVFTPSTYATPWKSSIKTKTRDITKSRTRSADLSRPGAKGRARSVPMKCKHRRRDERPRPRCLKVYFRWTKPPSWYDRFFVTARLRTEVKTFMLQYILSFGCWIIVRSAATADRVVRDSRSVLRNTNDRMKSIRVIERRLVSDTSS